MAHLLIIREIYGNRTFEGCGGSIITKNVILTAGHCVTNKPKVVISVAKFIVILIISGRIKSQSIEISLIF